MEFKTKAIIFFALAAILLPLVLFAADAMTFWSVVVLFVLLHVWMLLEVWREPDFSFSYSYAIVGMVAGLAYLLVLVWFGKTLDVEYMGFVLFVAYFISVVVLLFTNDFRTYFSNARSLFAKKTVETAPDPEIETFRKKDELDSLIQAFEISPAPKESQIKDISLEDVDFLAKEVKDDDDKNDEIFSEIIEAKESLTGADLKIDHMKENIDEMSDDVKSINEKVRLIAEKAILEDAQKKIDEAKHSRAVYASKGGEKYHNDRDCLSLRRVSKKDIVAFPSATEAKREGLRECGLCKK